MRYHATSEGNIPFTAAEEIERDNEEAAHIAAKPALEKAVFNATVHAQLAEANLKIIDALCCNDVAEITAHNVSQAALKATLKQ